MSVYVSVDCVDEGYYSYVYVCMFGEDSFLLCDGRRWHTCVRLALTPPPCTTIHMHTYPPPYHTHAHIPSSWPKYLCRLCYTTAFFAQILPIASASINFEYVQTCIIYELCGCGWNMIFSAAYLCRVVYPMCAGMRVIIQCHCSARATVPVPAYDHTFHGYTSLRFPLSIYTYTHTSTVPALPTCPQLPAALSW